MPTRAAIDSATARLSPVSITASMPWRVSSAIASIASGFSSSPMPSSAMTRGASGQVGEPGHGLALLLGRARVALPARSCPRRSSRIHRLEPMASLRPPTFASIPRPAATVRPSAAGAGTPSLRGGRKHRLGERMLAAGLDRRGERQRRGAIAVDRLQRDERRLAHGQRAGLVEGDHAHAVRDLERLRVLDQHAVLRRDAGAGHHRRRRGEAQRAGAGDHQHRHGVQHRLLPVAGEQAPAEERQQPRAPAPPARTPRSPCPPGAGSAPSSPARTRPAR